MQLLFGSFVLALMVPIHLVAQCPDRARSDTVVQVGTNRAILRVELWRDFSPGIRSITDLDTARRPPVDTVRRPPDENRIATDGGSPLSVVVHVEVDSLNDSNRPVVTRIWVRRESAWLPLTLGVTYLSGLQRATIVGYGPYWPVDKPIDVAIQWSAFGRSLCSLRQRIYIRVSS